MQPNADPAVGGTDGPKIFSFISLPPHVEARLRGSFAITFAAPGGELAQLLRRAETGERYDVVLTGLGCDVLDASAIAKLPATIRMIATYSVGTDHIDLGAARNRGLAVSNTPGTLVNAVADAAIFLMLGAARRASESIALVRSHTWPGWNPNQLLGHELSGRRLGIYGMGEIGAAIAHRARAFGMTIAYTNRKAVPDADAQFVAGPLELVSTCDVIVLAVPSTPETRGFVNSHTLSFAKPELILVNIARGDLVVDDDLITSLRDGRIFAAGLDVFSDEPDIDPRYFDLPNLFMTPHIGSSTVEARKAMGESVVRSISAFFTGAPDVCCAV